MKYKNLLTTVYLLLAVRTLFANMANPMAPHSITGQLVPAEKVKVTNERIDIHLTTDTIDYDTDYHSHFSIVYNIKAEEDIKLPLVFLALNMNGLDRILVNGDEIDAKKMDQPDANFPFLRLKDGYYEISYDNDEWKRISLDDAFYFIAKLHKGDNSIQIQYSAYMGYDRRDIRTRYKIDYLLFPSRYWSSFGPIELYLHLDGKMDVLTQDLGTAKLQTDSIVQWRIDQVENKESFHIEVGLKTNLLAKVILWLGPELLALIGSICLLCLHIRYIYLKYKLGKYGYALLLGNLIIPSSFYFFIWFWSSLANYLVNGVFDEKSRGFILLVIFTLPLIYLVYDLMLFIIDRSIRSRLNK
ncbi:hypothetical protein [Sphingobacterium sp.]|uniref:hypothetical protein n=1 Tax=Sphingobacterium sp. TaxID=341027 RepID=UPI002FD98633